MYFTGFADEASQNIDRQIAATKALGWKYIESRCINGVNIHNLPDDQFEAVYQKLTESGVQINCFGSEVANWGKDPFKEEDFQASIDMLKRAIPRMRRLGTKLLRGMSFAMQKNRPPDDPEVEAQVFKKVAVLVKMCEEAGIVYGHENCMNYGGQSHEHTLKLLDRIQSPAFKLIFDTGNPVFTDRRIGQPPYPKQSAWEFYRNVREFVYYVHIKDARYQAETEGLFPRSQFTWPGEGDGNVREIVADLLKHRYDGGFSIEPHLAVVFHDQNHSADVEGQIRFDNYVEYGRRLEKLVQESR